MPGASDPGGTCHRQVRVGVPGPGAPESGPCPVESHCGNSVTHSAEVCGASYDRQEGVIILSS